jgi:sec-independent protein translocase protein TatC
MADDFEAEGPEEEQEGGPVKSFLEHLEDLRWVLIKSVAALGVAMLICLIAGNHVVRIIKYPLEHTPVFFRGTNQVVAVLFGTNRLATYQLTPQQQRALDLGTNRFVAVQVEPAMVGTNRVLSWRADPEYGAAELMQRPNVELINLSPAGGFVVAFQVAFYGGLVLAAPFIFYFVAMFVFPALKMREKKYVYRGLVYGGALFAGGVAFCYFLLMPLALRASQLYSQWLGFGAYQWRAEDYISFVCKFMLGMGLGFELPVVILTLVKIGVLDYSVLSRVRRYMVVLNLFLGAILTTPEVITQITMFVPLQFLYELSVWVAWYWEQPDRAKARRRLALVFLCVVVVGLLIWLGLREAWPWIRFHLHH